MSKTIMIAGYGPGISAAVAERFGREGFDVALVARNKSKLDAAVSALAEKGIKAKAFVADLADPSSARAVVGTIRTAMGPLTALHWNAYGSTAGDLLTADDAAIRSALDIGVTSLLAVVQAALPDLKASKEGAVLVTNGGLAFADPKIDAMAVQWGSMGLAMVNAAKHKLVGLLAEKLKGQVYVGEVIVLGIVKGTAFDRGQGGLDPKTIGAKFWDLFAARKDVVAQVG
jgi:NAD(P)-dependent dehydrogenase (short-subunit alcohol dehydrogenase family)